MLSLESEQGSNAFAVLEGDSGGEEAISVARPEIPGGTGQPASRCYSVEVLLRGSIHLAELC